MTIEYKTLGRLPDSISFTRSGNAIKALRASAGNLEIREKTIQISDAELGESAAANVSSRFVHDGPRTVYLYQWQHRSGLINVCAVISFREQKCAITRRLKVRCKVRPDLTKGIIVDFGEAIFKSANSVRMEAGLGDGYYPIFVNYNYGFVLQSVVLDFKIWDSGRRVFNAGQVDEYGLPTAD